jgi:hypothetical protein
MRNQCQYDIWPFANIFAPVPKFVDLFDEEKTAQAWAASYKGNTVMVHVDPRDQSRSVLRKEEL